MVGILLTIVATSACSTGHTVQGAGQSNALTATAGTASSPSPSVIRTLPPSGAQAPKPVDSVGDDHILTAAPSTPAETMSPIALTVDHLNCADGANGTQSCSFRVGYGNESSAPVVVDALTTVVVDADRRTFSPQTYETDSDTLVVNPGLQDYVEWSVTTPANTLLTQVRWQDPLGDSQSADFSYVGNPQGAQPSFQEPLQPTLPVAPSRSAPRTTRTAPRAAPTSGVSGSIG